jgi:hypothetical protein
MFDMLRFAAGVNGLVPHLRWAALYGLLALAIRACAS